MRILDIYVDRDNLMPHRFMSRHNNHYTLNIQFGLFLLVTDKHKLYIFNNSLIAKPESYKHTQYVLSQHFSSFLLLSM